MKKVRVPIPPDQADDLLFRSDRTCCVCRVPGKPIQIHHINDDPSDNRPSNLAVLCVVCHDQTQITGGFGRKLNAGQVTRYRNDWLALVEARRTGQPVKFEPIKYPEQRQISISAPKIPRRTVADQLNLLAAKYNEQTQCNHQMKATTDVLTGITHEYIGAMGRATMKMRLAKSLPEISRAREELADELLRIVTDYSIQAYTYRRIELEMNEGFRSIIELIRKIPKEYWDKAGSLVWVQSSRRLIDSRLRAIDSGQKLHDSANAIKGKSPRLDSILEHMQEAQFQTLVNKEKYLAWAKELEALEAHPLE
jgi:HNH endonuclease